MRQEPNIAHDKIAQCLQSNYALAVLSIQYLPMGYDLDAYVYKVVISNQIAYFVKIRRGPVYPPSVDVPAFLVDHGIPHILAPIKTMSGALFSFFEDYTVTVYPYIVGENAMKSGLTSDQWRDFGKTIRAVHSREFTAQWKGPIPTETFSIPSAALVRRVSGHIEGQAFATSSAQKLAEIWREKRAVIDHMLIRAEALGRQLQATPFDHVLCHTDIHAANILVSEAGAIYLVDWEAPLLAPRERDLLFVVGSPIARKVTQSEEAQFFEGYGNVEVNMTAHAYYRYERAIEDIGVAGKSVFLKPSISEEEREDEIQLFNWLFSPGDTVELAMEADKHTTNTI